jgi:uncharacterized protein
MKTNLNSRLTFLISISSILLVLSAKITFSQEPQNAFPKATIPNSEMRSLHSEILNSDMDIYIKLPMSYSFMKDKKYPAWYFTDANFIFPLIANIASGIEIVSQGSKESVIIGIGYKIKDMADWVDFRTHDLTPINYPPTDTLVNKTLLQLTGRTFNVKTGNSAKFLDFIEKELIPFIESNYRIIPGDRYLGGYSYGGLFALYTMFTKTGLFTKYLAASPSIDFGGGALYKFEKQYSSNHTDLNAKLFMSAGGLEKTISKCMKEMIDTLRLRNYPSLSIDSYIFPEENHATCSPAALTRGYVVLNKR